MGSISSTYLQAAFTPVAPQSVRTQSSRQYLFTILGSARVKAVRRTLMKLSPVEVPKYGALIRQGLQPRGPPPPMEKGPQTSASFNILDIKHKLWKLCIKPLTVKCQRHNHNFVEKNSNESYDVIPFLISLWPLNVLRRLCPVRQACQTLWNLEKHATQCQF